MLTILETIYALLNRAIRFFFPNASPLWGGAAIVGLVLIAILSVIVFFGWLFQGCGKNNEKDLEKNREKDIEKQAEISVTNASVENDRGKVITANKDSQNTAKRTESAQKAVNKAKETSVNGVDFNTANSERCKTFPESNECQ